MTATSGTLTPLGRSLREPLAAVQHGAEHHVGAVLASREAADAASAAASS